MDVGTLTMAMGEVPDEAPASVAMITEMAAAATATTEAAPTAEATPVDNSDASQSATAASLGNGAAAPAAAAPVEAVDNEELLIHIKGIRFQNPSFGFGRIVKELQKLGGPYTNISAKRVRKHMKKHGLLTSQLEEDNKAAGVIKLMTVGDASAPHQSNTLKGGEGAYEDDWVAVELKVPGDRSGTKKHQATIMHSQAAAAAKSASEASASKDNKGVGLGTMYKVQIAVSNSTPLPMLCYNQNRTQSTFIHPDAPGFEAIRALVVKEGMTGLDKTGGGLKAYLYGKQTRQTGRDFVLIHVKIPAPTQSW